MPPNQRVEVSSAGIAVACGILEFGISSPNFGEEQPELDTKMSKYGKNLRDIVLGQPRERLANQKAPGEAFLGEET